MRKRKIILKNIVIVINISSDISDSSKYVQFAVIIEFIFYLLCDISKNNYCFENYTIKC